MVTSDCTKRMGSHDLFLVLLCSLRYRHSNSVAAEGSTVHWGKDIPGLAMCARQGHGQHLRMLVTERNGSSRSQAWNYLHIIKYFCQWWLTQQIFWLAHLAKNSQVELLLDIRNINHIFWISRHHLGINVVCSEFFVFCLNKYYKF